MIGTHIGLKLLVMAIPAIPGNYQLHRIGFGRCDVMRGMTVDTDSRKGIGFFGDFLSMYGRKISLLLLRMARSTDVRYLQS